jgi:hypothetical protein
MSDRPQVRLFVLLIFACTLATVATIAVAARHGSAPAASREHLAWVLPKAHSANRPVLVFRSLSGGRTSFGQIALDNLSNSSASRQLLQLRCERVYFGPKNGLCLARGGGFAKGYEARIVGPDLRVHHTLDVAGIPSRARVSSDGRYGSVTLFVNGHSYAETGSASTQTTLIDMASGARVGDLEDFTTYRGSRQVTADDVNFWGVTFARDSDRFYATLATGGKTYLVEGSVSRRTMRTIHENVECPSLSPDGTRIAYKKRVAERTDPWRLTILDLATKSETLLAETRSVDDQVEWLDDDRVLYGLDDQIWVARAGGGGGPASFKRDADSPAVLRW